VVQDYHEAESREGIVDFAIHIVLAEAVLGSQGTSLALRAKFIPWREARLVSVETKIGSRGAYLGSHEACLISREAVIGSQRTSVVSTETCTQEVAKGALPTLTFLRLRTCRGFVLPPREKLFKLSLDKVNDQGLCSKPNVTFAALGSQHWRSNSPVKSLLTLKKDKILIGPNNI